MVNNNVHDKLLELHTQLSLTCFNIENKKTNKELNLKFYEQAQTCLSNLSELKLKINHLSIDEKDKCNCIYEKTSKLAHQVLVKVKARKEEDELACLSSLEELLNKATQLEDRELLLNFKKEVEQINPLELTENGSIVYFQLVGGLKNNQKLTWLVKTSSQIGISKKGKSAAELFQEKVCLFELLEEGITLHIFSYLEAKDLKRTRSVCKKWLTLSIRISTVLGKRSRQDVSITQPLKRMNKTDQCKSELKGFLKSLDELAIDEQEFNQLFFKLTPETKKLILTEALFHLNYAKREDSITDELFDIMPPLLWNGLYLEGQFNSVIKQAIKTLKQTNDDGESSSYDSDYDYNSDYDTTGDFKATKVSKPASEISHFDYKSSRSSIDFGSLNQFSLMQEEGDGDCLPYDYDCDVSEIMVSNFLSSSSSSPIPSYLTLHQLLKNGNREEFIKELNQIKNIDLKNQFFLELGKVVNTNSNLNASQDLFAVIGDRVFNERSATVQATIEDCTLAFKIACKILGINLK